MIILYALSQYFSTAFSKLDDTTVAVPNTVEAAANVSTTQLEKANTK